MGFQLIPAINAHSKWLNEGGCRMSRSTLFGDGFLGCLLDLGRRLSQESDPCCQSIGPAGGGRR